MRASRRRVPAAQVTARPRRAAKRQRTTASARARGAASTVQVRNARARTSREVDGLAAALVPRSRHWCCRRRRRGNGRDESRVRRHLTMPTVQGPNRRGSGIRSPRLRTSLPYKGKVVPSMPAGRGRGPRPGVEQLPPWSDGVVRSNRRSGETMRIAVPAPSGPRYGGPPSPDRVPSPESATMMSP